MKWLGIVLMMVSALVGLIAWFGYHNGPWLVGALIFFIIGLIAFLGENKTIRKIEIEKEK